MKALIIALFALIFQLDGLAQTPIQNNATCSFLKDVRFENGVDTAIIKATFKDVAKMVMGGTIFKLLDKEKKIKSKTFTYQLGFQPENCQKIFYAPSNANNPPSVLGVPVYLTCVVLTDMNGNMREHRSL